MLGHRAIRQVQRVVSRRVPCVRPVGHRAHTSTTRAPRPQTTRAFALPTLRTRVPSRVIQRAAVLPSSTKQIHSISSTADSFLNGSNSDYVEEMYIRWKLDRSAVHSSWDAFFSRGSYTPPPDLVGVQPMPSQQAPVHQHQQSSSPASDSERLQDVTNTTRIIQMVRAFQVRGHFMAKLDPLYLEEDRSRRLDGVNPAELQLSYYGFTEADMDRPVHVELDYVKGFLSKGAEKQMTVREVYTRLCEAYSGSVGVEYMHIPNIEMCNWIREKFETPTKHEYSKEVKLRILDRLTWAEHFESFLAKKYATAKRFGLEGSETMIVGMKSAIDRAAELGAESVVLGMPHRGRLNVLSTVVRKPIEAILAEFAGGLEWDDAHGSGDVKYHLGMSHKRMTHAGTPIRLSLVANPSHLEAVNPVVAGKVRAKQFYRGDKGEKVFGLLVHGDAAFAGQGVVYETLCLSDLPDYSTGGTIHIICNNQIGFTTDPAYSRSAPYCTEVAKSVGAPIFHVNGDDPEAVARVCEIAAEWRHKFRRDVVVDIVGYRKHGHNEIDEPSFTQPRMYSKIRKQLNVLGLYRKQLVDSGAIKDAEAESISQSVYDRLEDAFVKAKDYETQPGEWLSTQWADMYAPDNPSNRQITGVDIDVLKRLGNSLCAIPAGFSMHPRLRQAIKQKQEMIDTGAELDWATAEALAFASLLEEGTHVRLSGQDVERGTFSHRHAVWHDQKKFDMFTPLKHLSSTQAKFSVSNSNLSEFAVLGFELGYSLENPRSLVLWEAQFGDFANGAQVIIDQFIASGEAKWRRQSGLVMLLPHGYEGQGPEHSSARLERYLQLCDDDARVIPDNMDPKTRTQIQNCNMQVMNLTTPANYFHALRRQLHRKFRKPLIIMSPKSLLRHKQARSTLEDMGPGTRMKRALREVDPEFRNKKIRRLIFCSGKVYFDLLNHRTDKQITDVAIARIEQLAPFPHDVIKRIAEEYKKNVEIVWVQEEHMNAGAWDFVEPRIERCLGVRPRYVGRSPSASTAAGNNTLHRREMDSFLNEAFA